MFRIWDDVNKLRVIHPTTGEKRELTSDEKERIVKALRQKQTRSFSAMRKLLGLLEGEKFNLEEGERAKLKGNETEAKLRDVLGRRYDELEDAERDRMIQELLFVEREDVLLRHGRDRWGLSEEQARGLVDLELPEGYLRFSEKAIKKMLPHMEDGASIMGEVRKTGALGALELAGYGRPDQRREEGQGFLEFKDVHNLANPLVQAALYEVRKLVNTVIRTYGAPVYVRVELARDLKNPKWRRQEIQKRNRENERRNTDAEERLKQDFGLTRVSREDRDKYKLWEECRHVCPYTGKTIAKEALLTESWEIEHIIPYSRSLDDSFMNKTLCEAAENRRKHNKTPWEAYGQRETQWGEIMKRTESLPSPKRDRFRRKEAKIEDFISRQLNDTRYIAREVKKMLEKAVGTDKVQVGQGTVTAALRRSWGLNSLLSNTGEKTREDHRHHAVDAVVVGLTSPGILQELSRRSVRGYSHRLPSLAAPWENFREAVRVRLDSMVVSHKQRRKVSGALHEETNYGMVKGTDGQPRKDSKNQNLYAVRKPVESLTKAELDRIADARVKEEILSYLKAEGVNLEKDTEKSPAWKKAMDPDRFTDRRRPPQLPNRNGPPVPIRKVRLHRPSTGMEVLTDGEGRFKRAVERGGNHHIVIYETAKPSGEKVWSGEVVSLFEAARRLRSREPVVKLPKGSDARFVMSLAINDLVEVPVDGQKQIYRIQKLDGRSKNITMRLAKAATIQSNETRLFKNPKTLGELSARKVKVDILGRVHPSYD